MCSSPKSSMAGSVTKPIKALCEDLSAEQRKRFAQVANRADDRRQQRFVTQHRWQQKTSFCSSLVTR